MPLSAGRGGPQRPTGPACAPQGAGKCKTRKIRHRAQLRTTKKCTDVYHYNNGLAAPRPLYWGPDLGARNANLPHKKRRTSGTSHEPRYNVWFQVAAKTVSSAGFPSLAPSSAALNRPATAVLFLFVCVFCLFIWHDRQAAPHKASSLNMILVGIYFYGKKNNVQQVVIFDPIGRNPIRVRWTCCRHKSESAFFLDWQRFKRKLLRKTDPPKNILRASR